MSSRPSYQSLSKAALEWYRHRGRSFPWRESRDPYVVLIGEVLLQRTRGDLVEPVFRDFMKRWPTPAHLGRARETTIARVIRPLGLAKRAPMIKELGRELTRRKSMPVQPPELIELPGVGPYIAHAVPVFARGEEYPLVDWVIARVLRRYFGLPGHARPNQDRALWERARRLIRNGPAREVWLGLFDFAAAVCKPIPACPTCPLRESCVEGRRRIAEIKVNESFTSHRQGGNA